MRALCYNVGTRFSLENLYCSLKAVLLQVPAIETVSGMGSSSAVKEEFVGTLTLGRSSRLHVLFRIYFINSANVQRHPV